MLAANRHAFILEHLRKNGSVRTVDLSSQLSVTDETIRRDLEKLERDSLLQRTHGGAIPTEHRKIERPFEERSIENIEAKKRIARAAVAQIESGDRIYLDASSTALQLTPLLANLKLTVLTHSGIVANALEQYADITLILAGGYLDRRSRSYYGPATIAALKRYRVDKAFLSGNGINRIQGLSETNEDQAQIKETIIPRSGHVFFLSDPSKLGVTSNYFFAQCDEIDTLVTTSEANHPILEKLETEGIRIIEAK